LANEAAFCALILDENNDRSGWQQDGPESYSREVGRLGASNKLILRTAGGLAELRLVAIVGEQRMVRMNQNECRSR
jgi:hypothetical protein